ncbi:MAG: cell division ATPase MinD [Candidatus Nanohaloarchaea archaeon]|nr:cell division ATPase MinD [Candidatus Nanohaloarchaea archaeon]
MSRIICVTSGKGGVGKTTLASNLSLALNDFGYDTLVVDANFTNPNLGFHLGVPIYGSTIHDVMQGHASPSDATFVLDSGLRAMFGGLSNDQLLETRPEQLDNILENLGWLPDYVILDSAAGLGKEAVTGIKAADEALIVTNPEMPSVTDALKTARVAEMFGTRIRGTVVNRTGNGYSMSADKVQGLVDSRVVAKLPESKKVKRAVKEGKPLIRKDPKSRFSERVKKLAADIAGIDYRPKKPKNSQGFLSDLIKRLPFF